MNNNPEKQLFNLPTIIAGTFLLLVGVSLPSISYHAFNWGKQKPFTNFPNINGLIIGIPISLIWLVIAYIVGLSYFTGGQALDFLLGARDSYTSYQFELGNGLEGILWSILICGWGIILIGFGIACLFLIAVGISYIVKIGQWLFTEKHTPSQKDPFNWLLKLLSWIRPICLKLGVRY